MSEPFLAEIRMVGFNFAPRGWAFCDGQLLPINQNQSLFSLVGTSYGGDGRTSFGLPDLRGRVPIGFDDIDRIGTKGGTENHALNLGELPSHNHQVMAKTANAHTPNPSGQYLAHSELESYAPPSNLVSLKTQTQENGGNQPHNNMQPYIVVNFCIALQGLFPSRN